MMTNFKIGLVALALAATAPAFGQDDKSSIIGAWRMTSLQSTNPDGSMAEVPSPARSSSRKAAPCRFKR